MSGSFQIIGTRNSSPHEKGPGFLVVGCRKGANSSDGLGFINYFMDEQEALDCLKELQMTDQWNMLFMIHAQKGVWS